ncbi:MAG: ABC transporter permease [Planctomycetota bacterium]
MTEVQTEEIVENKRRLTTSSPAGRTRRFIRCLRFEIAKTRRRALPWLGILAAALAVFSVPAFSDLPLDAGESWTELAEMVRRGFEISSLLLVILGASCVNCERQSSALRAYLLRPVARSEIVAAKAATLFLFALILIGTVLTIAWLVTKFRFGFGPVLVEIEGLDPVLKFDLESMRAMALKLQLVATLPLFFFAALGLLVSTLIDSEATAVTLAILSRMFFGFLAEAFPDSETLMGLRAIEIGYERCAETARGIETQVQDIEALGFTHPELLYPLFGFALFLGVSKLTFCTRELNP